MANLIYSYTSYTADLYFYGSSVKSAQSFTVPSGYTRIAYVQLYQKRVGSPGYTERVGIHSNSGGRPGTELIGINVSTNSLSTSLTWNTYNFSDCTVTPGGTYHVNAGPFGPSSSNIIECSYGTTGSGLSLYYYDSGSYSWHTNYGSYDNMLVKVYGYGPPASLGATTTSSVGETSFYASSSVGNDMGASVSERGFCYSTSDTTPDTGDSKKVVGSGTGSFGSTITGLSAGVTYYIRSYAINAAGTTYGAVKTQTTDTNPPSVTTGSVSNLDKFSATVSGEVTSAHGATVTTRGICYNTSGTPTTSSSKVSSGSGVGSYSCNLTSLSANTTYYARAYATNSQGTSYGGQISFTTLKAAPTVTTSSVTNLLDVTATLGGNVTDTGGSTVTERGVVYATSSNPTTSDNKLDTTGTTGSYTVNATGLTPATTYHCRAYAINAYGTAYGSDVEFTSEPTEPSSLDIEITGKTTSTLTWTKGTGADTTVVRRATGSYPTGPTNGTGVYSGSGVTTNDTGLTAGTTYYYRIWSLDGASNYSTDYDSATDTTDYAFTNPTNAYSDNSTYTTAPANDDSIYIKLSKDGGTTWHNEIEATLPAANGEVTFGDEDEELWGYTWTGDDVDDTSFAMMVTVGSDKTSYHILEDFGFSITSTYILTGIEVVVKGYFDTDTAYIDHVKMKIHYGTSVLPIVAGTQAYDSTNNTMVFYDGTQWQKVATV
jgi:hypothetical protein